MSVDVEIYMNNLIKFFRENPKDLLNLIPKNKEDEFYILFEQKQRGITSGQFASWYIENELIGSAVIKH